MAYGKMMVMVGVIMYKLYNICLIFLRALNDGRYRLACCTISQKYNIDSWMNFLLKFEWHGPHLNFHFFSIAEVELHTLRFSVSGPRSIWCVFVYLKYVHYFLSFSNIFFEVLSLQVFWLFTMLSCRILVIVVTYAVLLSK